MYKLIVVSLLTFIGIKAANAVQQSSAVHALDVLMQTQTTEAQQTHLLPMQSVPTVKTKVPAQNNVNRAEPSSKEIHLNNKKIKKVNLTNKFIVKRINPQSIAYGATGLPSLKRQPQVVIKDKSVEGARKDVHVESDKEGN
ncbi:hypothetical protein J8M20_06700 [Pseudoalteromonas luteoviolacea]|uniref:hypothetical protein n=1 Tax=Pseudoalteromonas luteoviolacea TaxID=43657 RepID=UPI001B3923DD|nr:hypothetical protein [Pseudoalteromonas luteoviolacea]MBQ4811017.1 hypothetical protein [Pseudoalteromonas luteoviolacea]